MAGDVDEARRLLAKGLDWVVLRRDEDGHLWAEVRGNLAGLLNLEHADLVARAGAGSPSLTLATLPRRTGSSRKVEAQVDQPAAASS